MKPQTHPDHTPEAAILTELILEVFKLNGRLLSAGDQLVASLGMSSARWQVLGAIAMAGAPQPVASIARNMGLTRQAVQRLVNELEGEGMLAFAPNPHHQRAKLVVFSPAGSQAFQAAADRQAPWSNRLAGGIAAADLQTAWRVVHELATRLESLARLDDSQESR